MQRNLALLVFLGATSSLVIAQPPQNVGQRDSGARAIRGGAVQRLMSLDKNSDGKLTQDEWSDGRLRAILTRADADKNGEVTRSEIEDLVRREDPQDNSSNRDGAREGNQTRGPRDGEVPRAGQREGQRRDGQPEMRAGRSAIEPGIVLSQAAIDQLQLNQGQQDLVKKLQAHVDAELAIILTAQQQEKLKLMQSQRPGRPN